MKRVVVVTMLVACAKPSPAGRLEDAPTTTKATLSPPPSPSPSASSTPPNVGGGSCTASGELELTKEAGIQAKNVSDVTDLAVAATPDKALITFAMDGDLGCTHDGCYVHEGYSFEVDAAGRPSKATAPPSSAAGIGPTMVLAPFALGSELFVMTQGHAGAAAMIEPGKDAAETIYVVRDGNKTIQKTNNKFEGQRFAVQNGFALGTGLEWGLQGRGNHGPPSVRVFRLFKDKPALGGELVAKTESASDKYEVPAIASDGGAETDVAIAYRHRSAGGVTTLFAGWIDPKTLKPRGRPVEIAKGDVGAPTLLLDGGKVEIVFASRVVGSKTPYDLAYVSWLASEPKPRPIAPLSRSTRSALAPAVAKVNGKFAIAFMDAEDDKSGAVWAGFAPTLHDATLAATQRSGPTVKNARDPEWGVANDRALLVWSEHDGPRHIRFTWCR